MKVPRVRISSANKAPVNDAGDYVLYWMTAYRRPAWNFALDRPIEAAQHLGKGLVVLEALRVGYPWASDRHHAFILEGMVDNAAAFAHSAVVYIPYVEARVGEGKGLLEALSAKACMVVTDDFPAFMLPKMTQAAAAKIGVRMERVDSNGIYPMRHTDRVFSRAHDFRRHLQKTIAPHLLEFPNPNPLQGLALPTPTLPDFSRWPRADVAQIATATFLASLPIDHSVTRAADRGGFVAARERLAEWVTQGLPRYGVDRNHPDTDASSRLSFWLHFGQLSAHEVFQAVTDGTGWAPDQVESKASGSREGWWNLPDHVESFLDELITWREIGFNMCALRPSDYDQFESLPDWAQQTLGEHADDPREFVYALEAFEQARTHDPIWNAAQRQLVREGRIHNYLRMLWGKKILHWTASPQEALAVMIELNNKYAIDGRDPNSYSGIFWVLGRYDRAWGPERGVFGKIRYMTSQSTQSKLKMKHYLAEYGVEGQATLL